MRKFHSITLAVILMATMPANAFDLTDPLGIKEEIAEELGIAPPPSPTEILTEPTQVLPDPGAIEECIRAPGNCPQQLTQEAVYQAVWPVVAQYEAGLRAQAIWQGLPPWFLQVAQRHYPIDLRAIRFATGINTGHGAAITFGNEIYFPRGIDLANHEDMWWMLHELQHSVQYLQLGRNAFLGSYVLDSAQTILETGSIDVHDALEHEQQANAQADQVVDVIVADLGGVPAPTPRSSGSVLIVSNACFEPVEVAVAYLGSDSQWHTAGFYSFGPGEEDSLIGDDGGDIRLGQPNVLFHAYSPNRTWNGPNMVPVNGRTYGMAPANILPRGGDFVLSVNC